MDHVVVIATCFNARCTTSICEVTLQVSDKCEVTLQVSVNVNINHNTTILLSPILSTISQDHITNAQISIHHTMHNSLFASLLVCILYRMDKKVFEKDLIHHYTFSSKTNHYSLHLESHCTPKEKVVKFLIQKGINKHCG